jgi:hypothetical protein
VLADHQSPQTTTRKSHGRIATAIHTIEYPGDPKKMASFLSIESNEQKLGAYLGYDNISHIRLLTMSWPTLRAYRRFDPIAKNMNKSAAFKILLDDEESMTGERNPEWDIEDEDDEHLRRCKRNRQLARILVLFERELKQLCENTPAQNDVQQQKITKKFAEEFPNIKLPKIQFGSLQSQDNDNSRIVKSTNLGPHLDWNEHRLESINRGWNLIKYFRYTL